jgi:hypothetical protein
MLFLSCTASMSIGSSSTKSFKERRLRQNTVVKPAPPILQLQLKAPRMAIATSSPETALSPPLLSSIDCFPPPPACTFASTSQKHSLAIPPPEHRLKRVSSLPGILSEWAQLSDDEEHDDPPAALPTLAQAKARLRDSVSTTGSRDVFYEASEELDTSWLRTLARQSLLPVDGPGSSAFGFGMLVLM